MKPKKYKPKPCKRCKCIFFPNTGRQLYCPNCAAIMIDKWNGIEPVEEINVVQAKRRGSANEKATMSDVIAFTKDYEKRTGRYLSYGRAVAMMERGGSGSK